MGKISLALLILFLLVFAGSSWYFDFKGPIEIRCLNDSDCTLVKTSCCPDCEEIRSVNNEGAIYINAEFAEKCKEDCNESFCNDPTGGMLYPVPKCIENKCDIGSKVDCETVCKYSMYYFTEPRITYLNNTAKALNLESIEDLFQQCCQWKQ